MKKAFYAVYPSEVPEVTGLVDSFITSIESGSSSEYDQTKSVLLEHIEAVCCRSVAISDKSWGKIQGILKAKSSALRKRSADVLWPAEVSLAIANALEDDPDDSDRQLLVQFLHQSSVESVSIVTLTR